MLVTDCHAHIYSQNTARYPLIANPYCPPKGNGTVEHLKQEMAANGIERVVAVHATTAYGWDNRFLADAARANAPWMVGVCTLDADDPASPDLLRKLARDYNVRGLRSYSAGAPERLDHPGVETLWRVAEETGVTITVRIRVNHANDLERLLQRHRELPVILDHCMYPRGEEGLQGETIQRVLQLAEHPNLYAKLTWLVESSAQDYPFEDTHPLMRAVVAAYGAERCVWGSDFPCELWIPKATYAQHYTLFTQALGLTEAQKQAILITTPGKLYFNDNA